MPLTYIGILPGHQRQLPHELCPQGFLRNLVVHACVRVYTSWPVTSKSLPNRRHRLSLFWHVELTCISEFWPHLESDLINPGGNQRLAFPPTHHCPQHLRTVHCHSVHVHISRFLTKMTETHRAKHFLCLLPKCTKWVFSRLELCMYHS